MNINSSVLILLYVSFQISMSVLVTMGVVNMQLVLISMVDITVFAMMAIVVTEEFILVSQLYRVG